MWGARDREVCDEILSRMKASGVRFTPTTLLRMQDSAFASDVPAAELSPAARLRCSQDVADWGSVPDSLRRLYYRTVSDIVRTVHAAGVMILAGTDGPGGCLVPGWALHKEMENLVSSGFTPLDALRAATVEPARFLGLSDSLGAVRRGMVADLVLLDANPLTDIRNARRVVGVMADGQWRPISAASPLGRIATMDSSEVRRDLQQWYDRNERAFLAKDLGAIMALRTDDFHAVTPDGTVRTRAEMEEATRGFLAGIDRWISQSNDIDSLEVAGDLARAVVHQHLDRMALRSDGKVHHVETWVTQREIWRRTPEGWKLYRVDSIRDQRRVIDGQPG